MTASIAFGFVAACAVLSALFTVRVKNLVHAALWLGVTLVATAVLYAMLNASFLAGVQVLLYVGGVSVLLIFGVMITRKHDGIVVDADNAPGPRGVFAAAALFAVLAGAIKLTPELDEAVIAETVTAPALGKAVVVDHVLAFEVLSLLLLIAIIGAVVLARRRDPAAAPVVAKEVSSS